MADFPIVAWKVGLVLYFFYSPAAEGYQSNVPPPARRSRLARVDMPSPGEGYHQISPDGATRNVGLRGIEPALLWRSALPHLSGYNDIISENFVNNFQIIFLFSFFNR